MIHTEEYTLFVPGGEENGGRFTDSEVSWLGTF